MNSLTITFFAILAFVSAKPTNYGLDGDHGVEYAGDYNDLVGPVTGHASVGGPAAGQANVIGPHGGDAAIQGPYSGQATVSGPHGGDASVVGSHGGQSSIVGPQEGDTSLIGPSAGHATVVGPTSGNANIVGTSASNSGSSAGHTGAGAEWTDYENEHQAGWANAEHRLGHVFQIVVLESHKGDNSLEDLHSAHYAESDEKDVSASGPSADHSSIAGLSAGHTSIAGPSEGHVSIVGPSAGHTTIIGSSAKHSDGHATIAVSSSEHSTIEADEHNNVHETGVLAGPHALSATISGPSGKIIVDGMCRA